MVTGPRLRCVCCALPARVIQHVAKKADASQHARLAQHHDESAHIRSARSARADEAKPATARATPSHGRFTIYDAGGSQHLPGKLVHHEGSAHAKDSTVNHAADNVGITLDFLSQVLGRDSLDGQGMHVNASVHYGDRFSNAMWTGKEMLFGDGDGVHILGFAHSLDIVAHELAHAITQHSIRGGLGERHEGRKVALAGQAGALNESFSDVFATLVKQWHAKQDVRQANWLVGEGILSPNIGKAVRSLKDPGNGALTYEADDQARDMRGYVEGGEVHANSGIPNRAFYLAAHALGGHSWEHAGPIWYQALATLKKEADFADAARATSEAASTLFGAKSKEQGAVERAWREVRVIP